MDYIWRKFLVGVNYWPSQGNVKAWRDFKIDVVRKDFDAAKKLGIDAARVFVMAQDCSTPEGSLLEECGSGLKEMASEAHTRGILLFPTLLVGHMSGKNWPIPWEGEGLYSPEGVESGRRFVAQLVLTLRDSPAVAGWVLTNEVTLYRRPSSVGQFRVWLLSLASTVRSLDPHRPVSVGDSISLFSPPYLRPENVRDLVDYASPHLYMYDHDESRHTMYYFSALEYDRATAGKVLLEEFGLPTSTYGEESHAGFVEVVLHGALLYGAEGALYWCLSDFDAPGDEPYLWEPHELKFGLLRADLSSKKAAEVVRKFSEKLKEVDLSGFTFPRKDSAILVPNWAWRDYQFLPETGWRDELSRVLAQSFSLARAASLQVTFAAEEGDWPFKLLLVPSTPRLLSTTWRKLLGFVEQGGTLYYSTVRLTSHSSASDFWEELFGVRPSLVAGSPGVRLQDPVLRMSEEFAFTGTALTYSFTPVDAEVLSVDGSGRPVLFSATRGKGRAILLTIPAELLLSRSQGWEFSSFYSWLGDLSQASRTPSSGDPRIEVQYLQGRNELLLGVINHSSEEKEVKLNVGRRMALDQVPGKLKGKSATLTLLST
ncbi:glycoside hydrolase [Sulfodiicoccus acidiphilus]|uniref:glycoside hydrolase n=1 Tax=Sulfodiicoccus acidiphilus TaxID=1670455 RepID=UPI000F836053|nr:glycoside hydrolase [Sulfodiicoccus acidiphilus]